MLKDMNKLLKLQREIKGIQKKLKKAESEAESADGMVRVRVNCEFQVVKISIDEKLLEKSYKDSLEKILVSTLNKAMEFSKEYASKEMGKITGGMNIPGLDKFMK